MNIAQRRLKLKPEQQKLISGHGLGVMIICFLISAWLHVLFFSLWSFVDRNASESYHFIIDDVSAPVELTLSMAETGVVEAVENIPETSASSQTGDKVGQSMADEISQMLQEAAMAVSAEDMLNAALLNADAQEKISDEAPPESSGEQPSLNTIQQLPMSMEEDAPKFKSYYTSIRSAVASRWIMPPEAKDHFRPGRLTVDFTIKRDGALMRIVVLESSSSPSLDHAGLEALRSSAPFPPFPEELKIYSQLDIRMHFDYQAQYIKRKKKHISSN